MAMGPTRGPRRRGCSPATSCLTFAASLFAAHAAVATGSLRNTRHVLPRLPAEQSSESALVQTGDPLILGQRNLSFGAGSENNLSFGAKLEKWFPVLGPTLKPQVFFLFMAYSKIEHVAIWDKFFDGGMRGVDYTILVHCVSETACRQQLAEHPRFLVIPTVPSSYCTNLVSGMNALLKSAMVLGGIGSPNDKFVFLSDSTLPVKPLAHVWRQLTVDQSSDFCIFPRNEWAEVKLDRWDDKYSTETRIVPKTHQWMVLSRKHAELSVQKSNENMDLVQEFGLNKKSGFRNTGCLDEFWHFVTIYSSLSIKFGDQSVSLEDFNGGPLNTGSYEIQGRCDTFVQWVKRAAGSTNNITHVAQAMTVDAGTDLAPSTETRPGSIQRFGRASLRALRNSAFLFVRKVPAQATFSGCQSLDEAFSGLVFQEDNHEELPVSAGDQVWNGAGIWLDNQNRRVSISSFEGAIRLAGEHPDMNGKGFYCKNQLEVTFSSGYKSTAMLSEDKKSLHWANGVVWPRVWHDN